MKFFGPSVVALIENQARTQPDALAIASNAGTLTYRKLARRLCNAEE
jgi:hypothetical protein